MQTEQVKSKLMHKKILIAEDEDMLRKIMKTEFQFLGAVVIEASSGNKAFALYREEPFDIIISDVKMPDGNGIDLITKIRELSKSHEKPLVFVCSGYNELTKDDIGKMGILKVFPKPYNWNEMISTIESYL